MFTLLVPFLGDRQVSPTLLPLHRRFLIVFHYYFSLINHGYPEEFIHLRKTRATGTGTSTG